MRAPEPPSSIPYPRPLHPANGAGAALLALAGLTVFLLPRLVPTRGPTPGLGRGAATATQQSRPARAGDDALRILSITPSGMEVPPGRQVVFQFDRPVVPIGRMERTPAEVPISITPALDCEWRWLDTSALACQLPESGPLAPATHYSIVVSPQIEALDGSHLRAERRHDFTTILPAVASSYFQSWRGPGWPQIYINFNQTVARDSLESHLVFRDRQGDEYPLTVAEPGEEHRRGPVLEGRTWLVEPRDELPPDAPIQLHATAGLASAEGPEPSIEDKTVVEFWTFPEPRFLGIRCWDNDDEVLELGLDDSGETRRRCSPLNGVALRFASPVLDDVLAESLVVEPDLAGGREDYDPWEGRRGWSRLWGPRSQGQTYLVSLPEVLRADHEYHLSAKAAAVLDEFGRPIPHDLEFVFYTDNRPPRAVLTHRISVLESAVPTHVPLVVTNLSHVRVDWRAITAAGERAARESLVVPAARNVAFPIPLTVRDWLGGSSGALLGHVTTTPPTEDNDDFFTQITPFQVHFKLGHRSSLAWVTGLASGEPVANARVRLYLWTGAGLTAEPEALTEAVTDEQGVAVLLGTDSVDPDLDAHDWLSLRDHYPRLFVRIDKDGGMALLPLVDDFSARAEGPQNSWIPTWTRRRFGHVRAWGTTAQGVYRLGDTVQYKLYVRDQSNERFVPPPPGPYELEVHDPMDKVVHSVSELELNEFGAFDGEFDVPRTGAVGWYRFRLSSSVLEELEPMQVLVADFTPAPFRASTELDGELYAPGDLLEVSSRARLHSGGPYGLAQTRVTVTLRSTYFESHDPKAQGFYFATGQPSSETLHQTEEVLDEAGDLTTEYKLPDTSSVVYGRLQVESAVRDDRGKYVAAAASARYVGRDRFVGIRQPDWLLEAGKEAIVQALVVDPDDHVVAGQAISIAVEHLETKASRVKGPGNAYLTEYVHEWQSTANCDLVSSEEPSTCTFTPPSAGRYRLTASVTDTVGRPHSSTIDRWASGRSHVLWETPPGHHLPVEPEKAEYRVGETARFLIRNPFPGGRALFTLERYGVQRTWSRVLESSTEVEEVEVEADQVPGFYFSVVVTSPRVERPPGDDSVDLGKPTFRIGYVRVPVRDPYKWIDVDVTPGQESYRPRQKVHVDLTAKLRHAVERGQSDDIELAVAVLDEAVFDLLRDGESAFDPYRGFYDLEPLDLRNYNLLTNLIGVQKFEQKGADAGGGGGAGPDLRSVFKFVSYWNPSLRVDSQGRASIELEVPDNLTGWRVLAMAATPGDRMGLGQGTFTVNQPIELRPALPNQLTEGDAFDARFTVMNRTPERRRLVVGASLEGPADSPGLAGLEIDAEPFKRLPISFPVVATAPGTIDLTVWAKSDSGERDALRLPLPIRRRAVLVTAANYGTTTDNEVGETVAVPADARTDMGDISVSLSPSVIGALEGAFRYIRDYPYLCWEQRLTKGVMASHFAELRRYLDPELQWSGHESLPQQMLADAADFQAPNGGMTYWVPEDRYASPYLSAYTALAFAWLRERGHTIPGGVEEKLDHYLDTLLRSDVFPEFYSRGMSSSVRAVALAALARRGAVTLDDLERYRRHVVEMDLFGKAHYLQAAAALDAPESLRAEVRDAILSHSNRSGGKVVFSESLDTSYERILHSAPRSNCAVLSALLADQAGGPASTTDLGDLPFRLVRSLTQERQRRDHWENTQENMFCLQAFVDYSHRYEKTEPSMTVRVSVDGRRIGKGSFESFRDPSTEMSRALGETDPGRELEVHFERIGVGRLYYATRLSYAPQEPPSDPVNAGIEIHREVLVERGGQWIPLENPMSIEQGELVRVELYVSLPAARNFVVVDDPVPGGLEPVNRELATASEVDADKGEFERSRASFWWTRDDWIAYGISRWCFYHQELRHDSVRFYSDYLPAGNYYLSYVAQAIAPGEFHVLPVKAEEMYDPDVFGLGRPGRLDVESSAQGSPDRESQETRP